MIVFAKTRWNYTSYTDYWKLVELSGYDWCYVDEMDLSASDRLYIISPMNGEVRPFIDGYRNANGEIKATLMQWNLERPSGDGGGLSGYVNGNTKLVEDGYLSRIMVADWKLAQAGGSKFVYVPMGSHEGLGEPTSMDSKRYDFIHLCCYSNHRSLLFDAPDRPKSVLGGFTVAPNGWGDERHERLKASRVMLNIHQDGDGYIEPQRFALAAAYGLPVLSEIMYKTIFDDLITAVPIGDILGTMRTIIHYYDFYHDLGMEMREEFTGASNFRALLEAHI
jgi:hypothetical protein